MSEGIPNKLIKIASDEIQAISQLPYKSMLKLDQAGNLTYFFFEGETFVQSS